MTTLPPEFHCIGTNMAPRRDHLGLAPLVRESWKSYIEWMSVGFRSRELVEDSSEDLEGSPCH